MATMYKNIKSGVKAELVEINDKTKMVTLKKEDGKFTSSTKGSFDKYWKKIEDDSVKSDKIDKKIETKKQPEKKTETKTEESKEEKKSVNKSMEKKADKKSAETKTEKKSDKTEKVEKPKKEKKSKIKKEALPVKDTLIKILDDNKATYKVVGKRIRVVDGDTKYVYFIPNAATVRMYIKDDCKQFEIVKDLVSDNKNTKNKFNKTAVLEFDQISTVIKSMITMK